MAEVVEAVGDGADHQVDAHGRIGARPLAGGTGPCHGVDGAVAQWGDDAVAISGLSLGAPDELQGDLGQDIGQRRGGDVGVRLNDEGAQIRKRVLARLALARSQSRIDRIDLPGKDEAYLRTKLLEMYANPLKNHWDTKSE